jgi:benzoyl-CoA reductase subunit C
MATGTSRIQAARRRLEDAACELRQTGNPHRALGFLTAYAPEELFHAAGLNPVFVFHTPEDQGRARAHLPSFVCWVVASALDQALAGQLDGLAGFALGKSCDATQGLADLWLRCAPDIPLFHFGMPTRLDGAAARVYLLAELTSLRRRVQDVTGRLISDDDLRGSIATYKRTRALVRELYTHADELSPASFYALLRAAHRTPKAIYNQHLAQLLAQPFIPPDSPANGAGSILRVILVGPALGDPALFDALDRAGARVAGDLFDLGERYFALGAADVSDVNEDGNPLASLADRLLALTPTPTKHDPTHRRSAHLLSLVRERKADGVIFARQAYCDPHGFDLAQMGRALDQAEIPYLALQLEQASQAGQLSTRVEAFCEMIRSA